MSYADGTPGRRKPDHIWIAVAVIADISAVVATARSTIGVIVVVAGVGALLAGAYRIAVRWGQPVDWRIALATVTMIAGSGALVVTIDRSLTAGQRPPDSSAVAGDQSDVGSPHGGEPTPQASGNSPTPTPSPSPSPSPSRSPDAMSLLDAQMTPGDGYLDFSEGPLKVNETVYEQVIHGASTCRTDVVSTTYQLGRKYRQFEAGVGLGDDTGYQVKVRFSLLADGDVRHTVVAGLGEVVPFKADVTGAFRITIRAEVQTDVCGGLGRRVYAAWTDPVVTP